MSLLPRDLLFVLFLVALALAAPTFENERPYSSEAKANVAQRLPVGERLAYAALSDLRLIEVKVVEDKVEKDKAGEILSTQERHLQYDPLAGSAYVDCVRAMRFDRGAWKSVEPELMILSIAAAENYNRQFLHRKFETLTERLVGAVGLDLDPTLGLTQVRASRARALLNARVPIPLNRAEVAEFLEDDCNALTVTGWWFDDEIKAMARAGTVPTVRALALRYNGGTGYHASEFPYAMVVSAAYQMLQNALDRISDEAPVEPPPLRLDTVACLSFDDWGKAVTAQRYLAVRDGRTRQLSRAQFLAMLGDRAKLRYAVVTPSTWTGAIGAKLRAHVDALAGIKDGRWSGRPFATLDDPDRVRALCEDPAGAEFGQVLALVGREGREDVEAALSAVRDSPQPKTESEEAIPEAPVPEETTDAEPATNTVG